MSARVDVRVLPEAEYEEWDRFVASAPSGSPYSTAEYLDILCAAAGGRFRVVAVSRGDAFVAGVALYEVTGRFGRVVAPRLLLYYNGLVTRVSSTRYPSIETSREVESLAALQSWLREAGYARLVLKSRSPLRDVRPFQESGWDARPGYTYVVPLQDMAAQWGRIEQNLRRLVGRCEREGLALGEDDDFDSFFRLHQGTHERKGVPLYLPRAAFERYFRSLRALGRCRLYHARDLDGRSVAAQLVLAGAHPVSHTVCAGADPMFLKTGASAFLRWKAFEALAALGYEANDLTDAGLGPVGHFKSQLGGTLEPYFLLSLPEGLPLRLVDGARRTIACFRGWR